MKRTGVVIAGTAIEIEAAGAMAGLLGEVKALLQGFLAKGRTGAAVTITYDRRRSAARFPADPIILSPRQAEHWSACRAEGDEIPGDSLLIGYLNGLLSFSPSSKRGRITLFPSAGETILLGSLYKLLFCFVSLVMAGEGKVLLHGAGLKTGQGGVIFLGTSGTGKTTLAGSADPDSLLSDEAPVVSRQEGVFTLHASPFSQAGLFAEKKADHYRRQATLTGIVFLHQAEHLEIKKREWPFALGEILKDHCHGLPLMDKNLKARVFDLCLDLCRSVPAFDLNFTKDSRVLALFDKGISGG